MTIARTIGAPRGAGIIHPAPGVGRHADAGCAACACGRLELPMIR